MSKTADFESLGPELIISSVEEAVGKRLTGLTFSLPSYINRVYELECEDGTRLIAKYYRPGRWCRQALEEEHEFLMDCAEDEIPVIAPMRLTNGTTLSEASGIHFAVFPKRFGREMEINSPEDWKRVGSLVGRIHVSAARREAPSRIQLHPEISTRGDLKDLVEGGFIADRHAGAFADVAERILEISTRLFEDAAPMRIHGDCHRKNLLFRPDEGIMAIDFDDMMTGPAVQDLWLLLPDHAANARTEINLLLEGYEQFREFDDRTLLLIEPLRAMRIIYFLAWCGRQAEDFQFRRNFPDWGSEAFWQREVSDLERQLQVIKAHVEPGNGYPS